MDNLSAPEVKERIGFSFSCAEDMPHHVFQSISAKNRTKYTVLSGMLLWRISAAGVSVGQQSSDFPK